MQFNHIEFNCEDDLINYFASTQLPFNLEELEEYAKENFIPICRPSLANFLFYFVCNSKPKSILEIGTAIGYSTIIMAKAFTQSKIDTIELDSDRLNLAKINIKKFNVEKNIATFLGDAGDLIMNMPSNSYDMIFLDGPKTQYLSYLPSLKILLKSGGTIIADNIYQRGMTIGKAEISAKHKATVFKMLDFVQAVSKDKDFISTILPMGDGVLIATKK